MVSRPRKGNCKTSGNYMVDMEQEEQVITCEECLGTGLVTILQKDDYFERVVEGVCQNCLGKGEFTIRR